MLFLYFTTICTIKIHDKIIKICGGANGILNMRIVESVLGYIQNDDYYPRLEE